MLGSVARKLRALGVDAAYYRSGDDGGLLSFARSSGRVILTSDRALAGVAARGGTPALLVTGKDDHERFRVLVGSAREAGFAINRGVPFCSSCGTKLEKLGRRDMSGRAPPSVIRRHRLFYGCPSCGKAYWRGSHWKKLRSFARMLSAA